MTVPSAREMDWQMKFESLMDDLQSTAAKLREHEEWGSSSDVKDAQQQVAKARVALLLWTGKAPNKAEARALDAEAREQRLLARIARVDGLLSEFDREWQARRDYAIPFAVSTLLVKLAAAVKGGEP